MIGEFVRYPAPKGATREDVIEAAYEVVPRWQANPDLLRKHFLWSDDKKWICGFYLWKTREAAEQGHDAAWQAEVEQRTGKAPEISYFDAFMVVDNPAGTVTLDGL